MFRDVVGQIRNLEVEKIVENVHQGCPFDGCDRVLLKEDVEDHKPKCRFRTRKFCSLLNIPRCDEEVSLDKLEEHPRTRHHELYICAVDTDRIIFENQCYSGGPGYAIAMLWLRATTDGVEFPFIFRVDWKDDIITWSPFLVASKEFVYRYACDIEISTTTTVPGLFGEPTLHCNAAVVHSLEAEEANGESRRRDFSATMEHLGSITMGYAPQFAQYLHRGPIDFYFIFVRIFDTKECRFVTFERITDGNCKAD